MESDAATSTKAEVPQLGIVFVQFGAVFTLGEVRLLGLPMVAPICCNRARSDFPEPPWASLTNRCGENRERDSAAGMKGEKKAGALVEKRESKRCCQRCGREEISSARASDDFDPGHSSLTSSLEQCCASSPRACDARASGYTRPEGQLIIVGTQPLFMNFSGCLAPPSGARHLNARDGQTTEHTRPTSTGPSSTKPSLSPSAVIDATRRVSSRATTSREGEHRGAADVRSPRRRPVTAPTTRRARVPGGRNKNF